MKKIITTILLSLFFGSAFSQRALNNVFPSKIYKLDLSKKKDNEINRQKYLLNKSVLSQKEQEEMDSLLLKYGEAVEDIWEIIGDGCSWYCGGGNYKVSASSFLKENGMNYDALQANDLNYKTAWVTEKNNGGIGEYIEYKFKNLSPRLTEIIISNGYVKSESAWTKNNRVKKIKLYINGVPNSFLNLKDSRTDQVFQFSPLGKNKDGSDLVLRFEIIEVYKGTEFNHTAITEIYFDGIDVH